MAKSGDSRRLSEGARIQDAISPARAADAIIARIASAPANAEALRAIRRQASKELAAAEPGAILAIADELIRRSPFGRFVACEMIQHHAGAMNSLSLADVEALGNGMASWGDVDVFACYIAGPAWRERRIGDAVFADGRDRRTVGGGERRW